MSQNPTAPVVQPGDEWYGHRPGEGREEYEARVGKLRDDPIPDPNFRWDGGRVCAKGNYVWFRPANGNGEHGWLQYNEFEAKRLVNFINTALVTAPKPTPSPAPEKPKAAHDLCATCGHRREDHAGAPLSGKTACSLTQCSCSEFRPPAPEPSAEKRVRWFRWIDQPKANTWSVDGSVVVAHYPDGSSAPAASTLDCLTNDKLIEEFFPAIQGGDVTASTANRRDANEIAPSPPFSPSPSESRTGEWLPSGMLNVGRECASQHFTPDGPVSQLVSARDSQWRSECARLTRERDELKR